jgi:hypothetical protein
MSADLVQNIVLGVVGSGIIGITGLAARRIIAKVDTVDQAIRGNGTPGEGLVSRVAVIESKLPNGEWREIKASLEELHRVHAERIGEDIREHAVIKASLAAMHQDLKEHAEGEDDRTSAAIAKVLARRKNYTRGKPRTR